MHLGVAYAEGKGIGQNLAQAYAWCRCALATAESPNDAASAYAKEEIIADAQRCLSSLQSELSDEQLKQGTQLAARCLPKPGGADTSADHGVDARDADGRTPLMFASGQGNADAVSRLLKEGAQPDLRDQAFGKTALMYAAENSQRSTAELLLLAGTNPEVKDNKGWTGLCYAALNIRPDVVLALLKVHPSSNVQTNDGRTPLIIAAREGNTKTVELLLEAGADPQIRDAAGHSALDWAEAGNNRELVDVLRAAGLRSSGTAKTAEDLRTENRIASNSVTLSVSSGDFTTDGGFARIRGSVSNPESEPVEGIRYVVTLYSRDGSRALDTIQIQSKATVAPGERAPMRLEF